MIYICFEVIIKVLRGYGIRSMTTINRATYLPFLHVFYMRTSLMLITDLPLDSISSAVFAYSTLDLDENSQLTIQVDFLVPPSRFIGL